jgi:hypothetical protein
MTIGGISLRDLHVVWPDLWPLLEPAVKRSPQKPDVLAELLARRADLWAVYEHGRPLAAIVTQLQDGAEKSCCLWLIGGSRVKEWAPDFITALGAWARSTGCLSLWGNGRRGWTRMVKQFGAENIGTIDGAPAWRLAL